MQMADNEEVHYDSIVFLIPYIVPFYIFSACIFFLTILKYIQNSKICKIILIMWHLVYMHHVDLTCDSIIFLKSIDLNISLIHLMR